jgi:PhnB protein
MTTKAIPDGYRTLTPQLAIDGAAKAIDFYKKAFGAEEIDRAIDPSGKLVWHASLKIGDSMIMVNDPFPGVSASQSSLWVYVTDVDTWFKRAVDAGATATMPPADMFWGDRMAQVSDPFGQKWSIAMRVRDMTPTEQKAAQEAFVAQMKKG